MEQSDIATAAIVTQVMITWIPWLVGIAAGGGLGLLCALVLRSATSARPLLRRLLVLLPWRTVVMALLMLTWSPLVTRFLGLGPMAGAVMVGGSVCILALAFTASRLVESWSPSRLSTRLLAGARTLAVASGLIAAGVGVMGGGGIGYVLLDAARLMAYGLMWKGLMVVLALSLALDVALGLAQTMTLSDASANGDSALAGGLAA